MTEENSYLTIPAVFDGEKIQLLSDSPLPEGEYQILITFLEPIKPNGEISPVFSIEKIKGRDYFDKFLGFTKKEMEVLEMLRRGKTNLEISEGLDLGEGTVRNYLHNMYKKVKVKNRTQLVMKSEEMEIEVSEE